METADFILFSLNLDVFLGHRVHQNFVIALLVVVISNVLVIILAESLNLRLDCLLLLFNIFVDHLSLLAHLIDSHVEYLLSVL